MSHEPSLATVERSSTFGVFSFVSGVLSLLLLLGSLRMAQGGPAGELSLVLGRRASYVGMAVAILVWAVFSIPFVVAQGAVLGRKGRLLAQTAVILSAAGILLLAFGIFTHVGALLSIAAAGQPAGSGEALYQASIWASLGYYLTDPGLMAWGFGQFLFGWLAWKSGALPNWLAVVGMFGGASGMLTLAVYQTPVLALVQTGSFAVWGFAMGVLLFGRRGD